MAEDLTIRAERSTDYPEIREVHAQAFDDGGLVADLADALRAAEAGCRHWRSSPRSAAGSPGTSC